MRSIHAYVKYLRTKWTRSQSATGAFGGPYELGKSLSEFDEIQEGFISSCCPLYSARRVSSVDVFTGVVWPAHAPEDLMLTSLGTETVAVSVSVPSTQHASCTRALFPKVLEHTWNLNGLTGRIHRGCSAQVRSTLGTLRL